MISQVFTTTISFIGLLDSEQRELVGKSRGLGLAGILAITCFRDNSKTVRLPELGKTLNPHQCRGYRH